MLNQTGVKTVSATTRKIILIAEDKAVALPCMVSNDGVEASDGKKIIKAGTPLSGSITARGTAFKVATSATNVAGIILHDLDVTDGTKNAQVLIFGFVDESKLDSSVKTLLTSDIKTALKMIQFVQ
jgi:hypothetical protein